MTGEMGKELKESNERIVMCITHLKEQRDELAFLIEKQHEERRKLETEMERITYKLCLINKSLGQRERAKNNYDKTLTEIEQKYKELVKNSGDLLGIVQKEYDELDSIINKKTNTEENQMGDEDKDKDSCCPPQERDCKCEERKVAKIRKALLRVSQGAMIDVEEPIKLEKTDESVSAGGSDLEQQEEAASPSEPQEAKEQKGDNESEDEPDYSFQFRKYS